MKNEGLSSAPNRSLDTILDESNIQGFIGKNKSALISLLVLIVAAVVGFGLYRHFNDKSQAAYNSKIYQFETTTLKTYLTNPADSKAVVSGMEQLTKEMGDYAGLLPAALKTADALMINNHLADAKSVLAIAEKSADNDHAQYFVLSRKAVVHEDLGETKEAIEVLQKMSSLSGKIFEAKTYVDLGRLYLKSGDKEKAKASFKHVIDNNKEEAEFVKIAQLYMAKL